MLTSLGLIFLLGLLMAAICQKIHLPRIIGMLFTGIILGPYVLNLLDVSILNISSQLRQIALIIILLKAGLSLDLKDLKKVGRSAVMLSCVPATCELLAFVIFAHDPEYQQSRCGGHGCGTGSSVTCCGGAEDGAPYGERLWHGEKYSADDPGRSFLR